MTNRIGIALGDVTGIGPEVTLKALARELSADAPTSYLILGDTEHVRRLDARLGLNLPLLYARGPESACGKPLPGSTGGSPDGTGPSLRTPRDALTTGAGESPALFVLQTSAETARRVVVFQPSTASLPERLAPACPEAANASMTCLTEGARLCLAGRLDALVTAPVNKAAIIRAGHAGFVGQTEYLTELAGAKDTAMMLLGADDRGRWLRVVLATTHLPLRAVADHLDARTIGRIIDRAVQACQDLGLPRARVGVCGLNPHAGEDGQMGDEEIRVIAPAVRAAQQRHPEVVGPLPADTLFHQAYRGDFDIVVAMYHDQGLGPLKMIGFDTGVNWTLGLPFIRTSPDHGTAYDIAGTGRANPSSMLAALNLAKELTRKRRSALSMPTKPPRDAEGRR